MWIIDTKKVIAETEEQKDPTLELLIHLFCKIDDKASYDVLVQTFKNKKWMIK